MSVKILIISGSDRIGSFNTQLAEQFAAAIQAQGFEAEVYDYSPVPLFSQNQEFPAPTAVSQLRSDIEQANGLLIICPEYNGSYPARIKNLIDWASRPLTAGDKDTPTVLVNKRIGIASVANSTYGRLVRDNLGTLLSYVGSQLMEGQGLGIRIPAEAWQTGRLVLDPEQEGKADSFLTDYLAFVQEH